MDHEPDVQRDGDGREKDSIGEVAGTQHEQSGEGAYQGVWSQRVVTLF